MTGNFALSNKSFNIQELRTVEVRNMGGGGTCLMNYKFTYVRSGKEEFLEGTYIGKTEDRKNPKNNGVWGDCGGGTVYLRKVPTSDFYTEPFLKQEPIVKTPDKKQPPTKPVEQAKPKPNPSNPVAKATPPPSAGPARQNQAPVSINRDSSNRNSSPGITIKPAERQRIVIPAETRERKNELTQTFVVHSKEITIRLYDNGEIDNDTISVYLNGKLILANKRLSASPITYTIEMDEDSPEQVLIMVAENMGRIPPNTSLMIVQDGDKRYQASITSTEQKNAMVRFRYAKPDN
jgi:hypothetical protein